MNDNFYKQLVERFPMGYAYHKIICDELGAPCDYEFIEVNKAFEELTGMKRTDIVGKTITKVLPEIKNNDFDWIACYGEIALNGETKEFEQFSEPLNKWFRVNAYSPEVGSFITVFTEITNERKYIKAFHKLSVMSENFLQWIGNENDYQKITDNILEISDAKFSTFNLYDEDGKQYTTMAMAGDRGIINKAMTIMGMKLDRKKWIHDPIRADKIKDKMVTRFPTLHDLAGDVIPKPICDLLTKSFGLGETVLIKVTKNNIMLGDFTLIMPKGKAFDKDSIVEIFATQLGLMMERKRSEDKLKESEKRFRELVQNLDAGIVIHAPDGTVIDCNNRASQLLGLSAEQMKGKTPIDPLWMFVNEDELPLPLEEFPITLILASKKPIKNKLIGVFNPIIKDIVWVIVNGIPLLNKKGEISEVAISFTDFTELKNSKDKISQSEEQYRLLTTEMQLGLALHEIICDDYGNPVDYRFIDVNDRFEQITGLRKEDIIGKTVLEVLPRTEKYWIETYGKVALTGKADQFENYSAEIGKHYSAAAYSPKKGQFAVIIDDITDRKEAEETIRQREKEYRTLAENAPDVIARFDESLRHVYINNKATIELGLDREHFLGKTNRELGMPEDVLEKWEARLHSAFQSKQVQTVDIIYDTPQGKKYYQSFLAPELSDDGEVNTVLSITRDVSPQKEIELELIVKEAELKEAHHMAQLGRWDLYHDENRLQWSETIFEIFEIDSEHFEASYEAFLTAIHPDDRIAVDEVWKSSLVDKKPYCVEHRLLMDDGRIKWVYEQCRTEFDEAGHPIRSIGIVQDITEHKQMENQIFNEKEQFKTTLLSVGDGVISIDVQGNVLIMNKISEQLTGWTQEEAFGKPMEEVFYIINEFTRERCENPVRKVLETGNIIELANHTILISKNGTERPIEDSAAPIKDEQGNTIGVVLVFRDFTDKKQKQEQIEFLSYNDQLTGLYNRRYYEQEIVRLDDEKYYPLSLIMADVNGLKLTNDAFGHKAGDLLLQKISNILKSECRENDILARIGGDEFVLLLPKTDAKNAKMVINRINTAIKNEEIDNIILSISMGYAVKQETSEYIDEVFTKAEDDMYRHKLSESTSMRSRTIDLIMNTLFEKNNREMLHSERVGETCKAIAEKMSFTNDEVNEIKVAGLMHDIGKIGISETILNKPEQLNTNDLDEIKRHSEIGYRILNSANEFSQIANYVLEHHEKWDGTGYPKGLKEDEISLQARIIAVADAFDAMTTDRAYRIELSEDEAIAEIKKCSGTHFDSNIAKVFVEKVLGKDWE